MVTDRNFCAMNKSKLLTNTSNEQQRLQVHSQARLNGNQGKWAINDQSHGAWGH